MQTSSFRTVTDPNDHRLVSIALWAPRWYRGRTYPALAPRRDMLKKEEAEYRQEYAVILAGLDPQQVFGDLGEDAILLCWELPGKFCHRRLVAEWLERHLGVQVPETEARKVFRCDRYGNIRVYTVLGKRTRPEAPYERKRQTR